MTKSMTTALQAPRLFRERLQAIRRKLDAEEANPAMAMLEIGVTYLDLEQTLAWVLDRSELDLPTVERLLKGQAKLRQLAQAIVDAPDFH
jgi:hypothetical protein